MVELASVLAQEQSQCKNSDLNQGRHIVSGVNVMGSGKTAQHKDVGTM